MPRIKTTRSARVALWALRIYLLILLGLIGLKFVRMSTSASHQGPASVVPAVAHAPKPAP